MSVDGMRPCVLAKVGVNSSSASLLESSLICPSTTRFFISAPVAESADALVSGPVTSLKKTRVFWEASITVLTPQGVFSFFATNASSRSFAHTKRPEDLSVGRFVLLFT